MSCSVLITIQIIMHLGYISMFSDHIREIKRLFNARSSNKGKRTIKVKFDSQGITFKHQNKLITYIYLLLLIQNNDMIRKKTVKTQRVI